MDCRVKRLRVLTCTDRLLRSCQSPLVSSLFPRIFFDRTEHDVVTAANDVISQTEASRRSSFLVKDTTHSDHIQHPNRFDIQFADSSSVYCILQDLPRPPTTIMSENIFCHFSTILEKLDMSDCRKYFTSGRDMTATLSLTDLDEEIHPYGIRIIIPN